MVSEQMAAAAEAAQQLSGVALPAPAQRAKMPAGGRVMVAMLNAATNNCPCTPCRLLRTDAKQLGELAMDELGEDGGGSDT